MPSMEFFLVYMPWLLLTLLSFLFVHHLTKRRHQLPPGPHMLSVIGNFSDLKAQPHRALARLAKSHGPLMSLRLGSILTVVASSPDIARDILQTNDSALAARFVPDAVHALSHDQFSISWLPPKRLWRSLRKICATELFAPHRLDALQSLRSEKVQQLLDYISKLAAKGEAVEIGRLMFTTTLNLLSSTIFSVDLAGIEDDSGTSRGFRDLILEIFAVTKKANVSDIFPLLAPVDLQGGRRCLARLLGKLHGVFDELIDRRLRDREVGGTARNDFLDLLLDAKMDDGSEIDRRTLKSLLMDLFVAGSDTSSVTLEWAMAELLRNQQLMAKACDELEKVIGSKKEIEESDIKQLPYLQVVVKETFRLHPSAPFLIPRKAEKTIEMRGYVIPEGTQVLVNVWAIGRDEHVWTEPEKFIPERFLEKEIDFRGHDFELIPFGAGRRVCPGMPLAIRMVHLVLASLLHQFKWRLPEDAEKRGLDMTEKCELIVSMAAPLHAIAMPV